MRPALERCILQNSLAILAAACLYFIRRYLIIITFAYNSKRFAIAFFSSLSPSGQCFLTDWQKLFTNLCPIAAFNPCPLETNRNGGLKREHLEFSSSETKNIISPLPQCQWLPNLAGC